MVNESGDGILGITSLIEQGERHKAQRVVPKEKSKGFVRVKYIHGRPYYYLVKSIREGGKVKQKIIKYLGTRKPRGIPREEIKEATK